jgi:hypothetical protein
MRTPFLLLPLAVAIALVVGTTTQTVGAAEVRLHLDVRFDQGHPEAEQLLIDAGFEVELAVPDLGRWQGWLSADLLDDVEAIEGVLSVRSPLYARFAAGDALTEGDEALNAAAARTRFNVDGSGVRIAVISDGITGLDQAIRAEEAPWLVEVRAFGQGRLERGQEGTVMIEIVHDLAPGASISFAAVTTDLDHIAAVNYYARRVDIIVDDVSFAFPADQMSDVSLNTTRALRHPEWPLRLYVTAAGNWAESHWSGEWRPGPDGRQLGLDHPGAVHQFNGADGAAMLSGAGNGFSVNPDDEIRLALFWDDPPGRSTNDYNLFLMSGIGEVLAASTITQGIGADNHEAREHLEYTHDGDATQLFAVIQNHNNDAQPVKFDLFAFHTHGQQLRLYHRTAEGSILAQSDARDALTVGAVNVGREMVASYSSRGPTVNGVLKPELSAVDRVTVSETTTFGPRFSGSSAAAPHVAGVAALLLEAQPALLASDGGSPLLERRLIRDILIETARDIPPDGPDRATGAGLIDADAAIDFAMNEITVIDSAADRGPGTLREALGSRSSILLLPDNSGDQTIKLASDLPAVADGMIIDGPGWTLNASEVDIGLRLGNRNELWGLRVNGAREVGLLVAGTDCRLRHAVATRNTIGIRVNGTNAQIDGVTVTESRSHGIEIGDGATVAIASSVIESNRGAGVRIRALAGDVLIGPSDQVPMPIRAGDLRTPIGPLDSPAPQPRSGLSHSVSGSVSIDGLPAAAGTRVDLYLDRRLAATVVVDEIAGFSATATGPGTEIRFAVDGVPLDQRLEFEAGESTSINLSAVSSDSQIGSDRSGDHLANANQFRDNQIGVQIMPSSGEAGRRLVWGNVMQGNRTNIVSELPTPKIAEVMWGAPGLSLSGSATRASEAHLYAGPQGNRQFTTSTPVLNGRFNFSNIDVGLMTTEISVIAHSADERATPESSVKSVGSAGSISSVSPDTGFIEGGETVQICGDGVATDSEAPMVWFGNLPARVIFWSGECVTVSTPASIAGSADIALQLPGSRPIVAPDAFEYRAVRVVRLRQGWNHVTWSGADTRVTTAFISIAGASFRAYTWDADQQQWQLFSTELPSRFNTLRSFNHDQPVWILLESVDVDWEQPAPE